MGMPYYNTLFNILLHYKLPPCFFTKCKPRLTLPTPYISFRLGSVEYQTPSVRNKNVYLRLIFSKIYLLSLMTYIMPAP